VRALLAALVVEAVLDRGGPPVARDRVERHPARAHARIADAPGAAAHDLEVVMAGGAGIPFVRVTPILSSALS